MKLTAALRKRQYSGSELLPSKASIAFWNPLLNHIQALHPDFLYSLCRQFTFLLLQSSPRVSETKPDPTYQGYIACWIFWASESSRENPSTYFEIRRYLLLCLAKGLSHGTVPHSSQPMCVIYVLEPIEYLRFLHVLHSVLLSF